MPAARILIAEDEGLIAEDLRGKLTRMGHEVVGTAASGEETIEVADRTRPDLALVDIRLDGSCDGIEAVRRMRTSFDPVVIYLTAYSDHTTVQRAKETEPFGYLIKPVQPRELQTTIEMALHKREMEQRLRASEQRWATTLASIGDAVLATDLEGQITFLNPACERLTHWSRTEAVGRPVEQVFRIIDSGSRAPVENPVRQALREGREVKLVPGVLLLARNGSEIPIVDCGAPISNGRSETTGCVLVFQDDSARRQAEAALRESEARLAEALRVAQLGSWCIDLNTGQAIWSDEVYAQLGLKPKEVPASQDAFLQCVHTEDRAAVHEGMERVIREGVLFDQDFRVVWRDSQVRHLHARGRRIGDHPGAFRFVGASLDVTARQRAEEERRQLEARFHHAQKLESLGVLAGGIAHDFNNLLTGILGYADLALCDLPADHVTRTKIEQVIEGGRQAAELTSQILAYAGKGKIVIQPVLLSQLVGDLGKLLAVTVSKKAELVYRLADDLPPVEADAAQLRQVVLNMIINASEALGEKSGTITLTTGVRECDRAELARCQVSSYRGDPLEELPVGPYVVLEVADTGCGMTADTLQRVFEPFFTTKFTGRGLGLAAVLGIVRLHRGALRVQSEPGRGSTFTILLPASRLSPALPAPAPAVADWRGHGTVLVVDDEESVREVAQRMLERLGFSVLTASDGQEAAEVFRAHADRIRLVLLDLTMPKLNGIETFRELRQFRPGVPVLLSSGFGDDVADRFREEGFAGFVRKPYLL